MVDVGCEENVEYGLVSAYYRLCTLTITST